MRGKEVDGGNSIPIGGRPDSRVVGDEAHTPTANEVERILEEDLNARSD
jgi:hypothetical protein